MILSAVSRAIWRWYTGLESQTQTPKCSKVLISGVSFRQHSLSQSQESNVLSYSERKIAKNFMGFAPGPYWGGLTALPLTLWLYNSFSPHYACRKTSTPKKVLDTALILYMIFKLGFNWNKTYVSHSWLFYQKPVWNDT